MLAVTGSGAADPACVPASPTHALQLDRSESVGASFSDSFQQSYNYTTPPPNFGFLHTLFFFSTAVFFWHNLVMDMVDKDMDNKINDNNNNIRMYIWISRPLWGCIRMPIRISQPLIKFQRRN